MYEGLLTCKVQRSVREVRGSPHFDTLLSQGQDARNGVLSRQIPNLGREKAQPDFIHPLLDSEKYPRGGHWKPLLILAILLVVLLLNTGSREGC